jgi:hypothetical protein
MIPLILHPALAAAQVGTLCGYVFRETDGNPRCRSLQGGDLMAIERRPCREFGPAWWRIMLCPEYGGPLRLLRIVRGFAGG